MTINTTTTRVDYLGNGVTTAFPVPFVFFGLDELQVIERVIATGAETILARGTHYSVTGGQGSTGTVTATTAPVAGRQWTIRRATQLLQQTDFSRNDPFPSDSVERALDRAIAVVQEIDRDQGAVLRVSPTDTAPGPLPSAAVRANKLFGFDASGDPIAAEGVLGSLPVTPFIAGLLDDPTQDDALATLGATTVGRDVFRAATQAGARAALGAPPTPTTDAGPGRVELLSASGGLAATLPAGGTWEYFIVGFSASAGVYAATAGMSVAAGGTVAGPATVNVQWIGFARRIA